MNVSTVNYQVHKRESPQLALTKNRQTPIETKIIALMDRALLLKTEIRKAEGRLHFYKAHLTELSESNVT